MPAGRVWGARADGEASVPPGFALSTFARGLSEPIAIEFAPDGRLFVAERGGAVRVVLAGQAAEAPFHRMEVFNDNENGLLGMALDPDFAANGYVYVYATVSTREAQIIRLRERREAGGTGVADEVLVIRDHLPTRGGFHSGGGLKVGPDRKLYFGIGDNEDPEAAQDLSTLAGKISRINLDGSTPDDNPFLTPTGQRRATWAIGFRNPFRFCFAPDGRMFVLDVGSDGDGRREEINLVRAGLNYGWPRVEGKQDPEAYDPRYTDPIHDYHDGGAAPVGAVIYSGSAFPAEYQGDLFHLEFVLNRLYRVRLDGDSVVSHEVFVQGSGGPVDVAQGPDGALYYCEIVSGSIQRLAFVDADGERDPDVEAAGDPGPVGPAGEPSEDAAADGGADRPGIGPCGLGVPGAAWLTFVLLVGVRRACGGP